MAESKPSVFLLKKAAVENTEEKRVYTKQITSYKGCRRFLAWMVKETLAGRLEANVASKLTYVINSVMKSLELEDLEVLKQDMAKLDSEGQDYE